MARILATFLALTRLCSAGLAHADWVVPSDRVTTRVVVREGPSSSTPDIGSLRPDERLPFVGSVPRWHQVELTDGTPGFVSKGWTRIVPETTVPTAGASFTIDVVDVATGLAVVVTGADFVMIYDGGSNDDDARGTSNRFLAFLQAAYPSLATIDHVILSHPHKDHVELLPDILAQYDVDGVWDSGRVYNNCGYRAFIKAVSSEPGLTYHSARFSEGAHTMSFPAKATCYGQLAPQLEIGLQHGPRIDHLPIEIGIDAWMTFLHASAVQSGSPNRNSLVVRLDLGDRRILFMGDAEAGERASPSTPPAPQSIERILIQCCASELAADILIVGHHGSMTSSRREFLDHVNASTLVVSSGPQKYGSVVLPDQEVITELASRGMVSRTDQNDGSCPTSTSKVGPDNDGKAGGCDNIRIEIQTGQALSVSPLNISD